VRRLSAPALREIETAYTAYEAEVRSAGLRGGTVSKYLLHSSNFVHWLRGDFHPGTRGDVANQPGKAISLRTAEDVWLEILYKCVEHLRTKQPIFTYTGVPNYITAVDKDGGWIERHSESPRTRRATDRVHKTDVVRIWNALSATGRTENVPVKRYFAYALLARLIKGVAWGDAAGSLYFSDASLAMTPFRRRHVAAGRGKRANDEVGEASLLPAASDST
jgi:hypothetical protein